MAHLKLADGTALYYQQAGVGEPVVFINGLTMDTSSWQPVAAQLAARYATLCYDCRGQGQSDKPPGPYAPQQHAADLAALLEALGLARVHLVGLSNGGLVAALYAGMAPERVASFVAIDSFARVDPLLQAILRSWRAALAAGGPALRFEVAIPWVWGHSFLAERLDEVLALRDKAAQVDPAAIAGLIEGLLDFNDAKEALAAYRGPLLAVVGEEDVLTPKRYSQELLSWAGRGRLIELPAAGHAAPIERPEAVSALLLEFLAGIGGENG